MTDVPPTGSYSPPPTVSPAAGMASDERQMPLIIYILLLIPVSMGITHIVGLVLAYVQRDTAPDWLKSHYTFQIRTFWIGLVAFVVACLACFILVGFLLVPAVMVWYVVRLAIGISRLSRREPIADPQTWMV